MSLTNIKQELLEHVGDISNVKAVQLKLIQRTAHLQAVLLFHLPEHYSEEDLAHFLRDIDTTYDDGYGWQELFGFIWWKDGTWSSRYEYDGRESWVHNEVPNYPLSREEMAEL